MDQIIDNLWLGGLDSFYYIEELQNHNIGYVLTALRGEITLPLPLIHYQVELDDTESDDLLVHLPPAVAFIDAALKSGKGVLVHCMAGISRSPSIVAAYLMYAQGLDLQTALINIQGKRPIVGPNDSFLKQLELFHAAACKLSSEDRAIRRFYLERAVHDVMKGETEQRIKGAPYSGPELSPQSGTKRRIRCRMCRQELASADHIMHSRRLTSESRPALESGTSNSYSEATVSLSSPLGIAKLSEDVMKGLKQRTTTEVPAGALGVEIKQTTLDAQLAQLTHPNPTPSPDSTSSTPALPMRATRTVVPPASRPPVSRPVPRPKGSIDAADATVAAPTTPPSQIQGTSAATETIAPPPPIIDPACSGYFVEPMKWMEESSFAYGQIDGRILCPNSKCGAKLGNYAWAGVRCSCGEWVVPGFCIHKTRVDELWN